jgi:uncharacterized integral membrane protein
LNAGSRVERRSRTKEQRMYIGVGTVLLILLIVLIVMMMRGRRTI